MRIFLILFFSVFVACDSSLKTSEKGIKSEAFELNTDSISLPNEITFNEHVVQIIYTKCAGCHREGESGPFSLLTYDQVYKKKKTIVKVISNGSMPPWPADRSYSNFVGELFLTEYEKSLIKEWVQQGAKEGSMEIKASLPKFTKGSQIGKPDLVIKMPKPVLLKGNNKDNYLIMKIPFEIPQDKYVKAIEFVPGNRKRVHHVNGYILVYEQGKKKNLNDGEYYVSNYETSMQEVWKKLKVTNDDGTYPLRIPSATNYLPGVKPAIYPDGIGGFLMRKRGAILLNDIHYGPTAIDEYDQSNFNVFFTDKPITRKFKEFQLGNYGVSEIVPKLLVPPDSIKTFYTQYTIEEDMSLLTVNPHMHLLGKEFLAYAVLPNQSKINLIRIPNWDFRWQYFYTFKKMVYLPKGSTIFVEATYDNTRKNPNNPNNPPKWVGEKEGSMSTKDEMLQFIVTYLPYQIGDESISLEQKNSRIN